jgi:hypothetical protein
MLRGQCRHCCFAAVAVAAAAAAVAFVLDAKSYHGVVVAAAAAEHAKPSLLFQDGGRSQMPAG